MKQSEKLDLVLKELYKYKNDSNLYSIVDICQKLKIPFTSDEIHMLAKRLMDDGYVEGPDSRGDLVTLSSHGIDYCEEDSYSYSGLSLVTNNYSIQINNSPNANIVNESSNVTITQNFSDANQAVERIREVVATDSQIEKNKASEILECLNEIQESLKNNQKPKYAFKMLLDITAGIASIAGLVTVLGQYAGIIPMPGK